MSTHPSEKINGIQDNSVSIEGFRISPQQRRLWRFLEHAPGAASSFCGQAVIDLRGELDLELLEAALAQVTAHHEILRTTFRALAGMTLPLQVVEESSPVEMRRYVIAKLTPEQQEQYTRSVCHEDRNRVGNFAAGRLVAASCLRLSDDDHRLVLTLSALCGDTATLEILLHEIASAYGRPMTEMDQSGDALQYADYSEWQNEMAESEEASGGHQYFRSLQLDSLETLALPNAVCAGRGDFFDLCVVDRIIDLDTWHRVEEAASDLKVSRADVCLAAWCALLWRMTDQPQVVVGRGVDGRSYADLEAVAGLMWKYLPLVCQLSEESTLAQIARSIEAANGAAERWQDAFNWEHVTGMVNDDKLPLRLPYGFDFVRSTGAQSAHGVTFRPFASYACCEPFDMRLCLLDDSQRPVGRLYIDGGRVDERSADDILERFTVVLSQMLDAPSACVGEFTYVGRTERHRLLNGLNETAVEYPREKCFHQLFEEQAARGPDRIAAECADAPLSYATLNARANQLARELRSLGVERGSLVGLCVERSVEMLIGILGVAKAGAAYVPLDPVYPAERLRFMVEDAGVKVLLSQQSLVETHVDWYRHVVVCLDSDWRRISRHATDNLPPEADPDDLVYVLYTSGSTGKPKGVEIPHRALVNFLCAMENETSCGEQDVLLAVTTLCFDIAGLELFLPLFVGGRVVIASRAATVDPGELAGLIDRCGITVMQATPATWRMLVATGWEGCSRLTILCGGEALPRDLADQLLERSQGVKNMYGPTETTIWSAVLAVTPGNEAPPVGPPIANTRFYVLDDTASLVPFGVPGELCIGGNGLARGYRKRPELNQGRFIPDPFAQQAGTRLYRTGDRVRYLSGGRLEFVGRMDQQVKIRGFRIELGEIEAILNQLPGVRQVAALVPENAHGEKHLVAYLITDDQPVPQVSDLRHHCQVHLPDYMVPAAFIFMDAFPLTLNGKIDRKGLSAVQHAKAADGESSAPHTILERLLTEVWSEVLSVSGIGVNDNFFELGGDSIQGVICVNQLQSRLGEHISVITVFEAPTVAEFTAYLEAHNPKAVARLAQGRRQGELAEPDNPARLQRNADRVEVPLSFFQQRLWFLNEPPHQDVNYNVYVALEMHGSLDVQTFEDCMNEIVRRHEALRTWFTTTGVTPVQRVEREERMALQRIDLSQCPRDARDSEARRLLRAEANRSFPLDSSPLLSLLLIGLDDQEHFFMATMPHIVMDGWSSVLMMRELRSLYEAKERGESARLLTLPVQYADFVVWQRQYLQRDTLVKLSEYWTDKLAGVPMLELPTDFPRPPVKSFRGATEPVHLSPALARDIRMLSRREGVTLFMTLLAAYQWLLARLSGQEDIVVGTPVMNRNQTELEGLIGFFANMIALRTDLSGNPPFRESLARVRETALGAYGHQDMPFVKVMEALGVEDDDSRTPLVQAYFVLEHTEVADFSLPTLTSTPLQIESEIAMFDLSLTLVEKADRSLRGTIEYSTDLYTAATIKDAIARFEAILKAVSANPDSCLLDERSSPHGLAIRMGTSSTGDARLDPPLMVRVPRNAELPLSFAQQRLWFLDQLEPDSSVYNMPLAVRLRGALDVIAMSRSLHEIVKRHETLRTTFPDRQGHAIQQIAPSVARSLWLVELDELPEAEGEVEARRLTREESSHSFDLARGPLLRSTLLRFGKEDHVLLLTLHHIVSDGWSMGVLMRELGALYKSFSEGLPWPLRELPVQYADFAVWQRDWLRGEVLEKQLSYWRTQLEGAPELLDLPTDRPRPAVQTYRGAQTSLTISPELSEKLRTLSHQKGVTLFMTLLAAFQTLLHRYTGQENIVVGSPIANRRHAEIEGLIGLFVNTLVLRADLSGTPTFTELLRRVRGIALDAYAHQDLPFEQLVEELQPERNLSHSLLFQVMFSLRNASGDRMELPGMTCETLPVELNTAKFDLTLSLHETLAGLAGSLEYNTDLFDSITVHRMMVHFTMLLEGVVEDADQRVSVLPLITEAECHKLLVEWNDTETEYPQDRCIHELFEEQVERTPEAVAVVFSQAGSGQSETQQVTYRELNQRANQLAHYLRSLGVGPEVKVGICMERSVEMVVGLLGILKAGGPYLPLDPTYPKERLAFMIQDSSVSVLLTQESLKETFSIQHSVFKCQLSAPNSQHSPTPSPRHRAPTVVCLDEEWGAIAQESSGNPRVKTSSKTLAYIIYTSGSTGSPKGVMIPHQAIVNHMVWMQATFSLRQTDRVVQETPFGFDASVWKIFAPLLAGAQLVMTVPGGHQDTNYLARVMTEENVTTLQLVPSLLETLLEEPGLIDCRSLRRVFCGGEALYLNLQRRAENRLKASWYNLYGPTEACIDATYWTVEDVDGVATVPIGKPISNTAVHVLDGYSRLIPVGVSGELHIGGEGLAQGYLNRPELTAEKFIPDPFRSKDMGGRLYRTGDLVRHRPDHNIEFLGRIDHQVKIRGFRIELEEIETVLGQHPAVREAVVTTRPLTTDDRPLSGGADSLWPTAQWAEKRLVGYLVADAGSAASVGELRSYLAGKLPE